MTITFGGYENVTNPEMDGVALSFPFTVVDSDSIGFPEEHALTRSHRLIVSIADTRRRSWGLSDQDLPLVLFEFGQRFVKEHVSHGTLSRDNTIRMPMITTESHRGALPFALPLLEMPDCLVTHVEVDRRAGFMT